MLNELVVQNRKAFKVIFKLYTLIIFFLRSDFLLTISSILVLIVSQLLLLVSYLLPIKIILLLAIDTIPVFLSDVFIGYSREEIILILSFSVFIIYGIHLILEKAISFIINRITKRILLNEEQTQDNKFNIKYIDNFFKFTSTLSFVAILFILLFYFLSPIAIALVVYLIIVCNIFLIKKLEMNKVLHFFKFYFYLGFMLVFLLEVFYLLYINTEKVSIIVILLSIVSIRYIFSRGVFLVSKMVFLSSTMNLFCKQITKS